MKVYKSKTIWVITAKRRKGVKILDYLYKNNCESLDRKLENMNLFELHTTSVQNIMEGWARRLNFSYDNWHVDPTPNILKLGEYIHPTTGNTLVAGINLNYLTPQQVLQVREFLPSILQNRHLKLRYWKGMEILPDIFDNFYRTYDRKYINVVEPGTLRFLSPTEVQKLGKQKEDEKLAQRKARVTQQKGKQAKAQSLKQDIAQAEVEPEVATAVDKGREAVKTQQAQRNIKTIEPAEVPVPEKPVPETPAPPKPEVPEAPGAPPEAQEIPTIMPKAPALRRKATPEAPEATAGTGPQPNRPGEAPEQEPGAPIPSKKPPKEEDNIIELPSEEI